MVVAFLNSYDTLHNPNEKKKPRKRKAKSTMKNAIDDLGMVKEDEGCCITQNANLCNKRKVIYYALGFKHKLFETNKDTTPKTIYQGSSLYVLITIYTQLQMKNKEKLYSKHVLK